MACIVKLATEKSKGVVSFTTQEERVIRANADYMRLFEQLKQRYVVCLHYNWHNFDCKPDDLFDIHLAGAEDLVITNGSTIFQIPMDACNFVRPEYHPSVEEKTWDILFVGNPVFFKNPLSFVQAIRDVYNSGVQPRALYICPMPPYRRADRKTVIYDIRERYEAMFSNEEQTRFNMLNIYHNYPRFFDRETLACFYRNSKVFVHTASDERRCRVAAYAWACGAPVVGKECVGSLLPKHLRRAPFFYEVGPHEESYAPQILRALADLRSGSEKDPAWVECRQEFMVDSTVPKFKSILSDYFHKNGLPFEGSLLGINLDHRLGRHHGLGISTNTVNQNLGTFISKLLALTDVQRNQMQKLDFAEECLLDNPASKVPDHNALPWQYRWKNKLPRRVVKILGLA